MHKRLCSAKISWIWGCLNFVNLYYVQLYVNLYYTAETVINLLSICYESETLYYVQLYVNLYCTAEAVINLLWEARKFWKYIAMLPILSSKCISQFTLVIATAVNLCSMHDPFPIHFWKKFCVFKHPVLSMGQDYCLLPKTTISPPF